MDDKLIKCIWKKVIEDNLKGIGTTFNKNNLKDNRCYRCDGYNCLYTPSRYAVPKERDESK